MYRGSTSMLLFFYLQSLVPFWHYMSKHSCSVHAGNGTGTPSKASRTGSTRVVSGPAHVYALEYCSIAVLQYRGIVAVAADNRTSDNAARSRRETAAPRYTVYSSTQSTGISGYGAHHLHHAIWNIDTGSMLYGPYGILLYYCNCRLQYGHMAIYIILENTVYY